MIWLSAVFAILKHFDQLAWEWSTVLLPLSLAIVLDFLVPAWRIVWTMLVLGFDSKQHVERVLSERETAVRAKYDKKLSHVKALRRRNG